MAEIKGLHETCEVCQGYWHDTKNCEACEKTGWQILPEDLKVYVNVYAITRHYGGPEEGGWYYNRAVCLEVYPTRNKNSEELQELLEEEYKHNKHGDIYSVLGGQDIAVYIESRPKESEYLERPHYE